MSGIFGRMVGVLTATAPTITVADVEPVLKAMQAQITWQGVANIVVTGIGAGVGFAFAWWGARKLGKMLMSAFKKGKISI